MTRKIFSNWARKHNFCVKSTNSQKVPQAVEKVFVRLSTFENINNVFKFVRIEKKGNPDGSLSNDPSLRNLKESGFIDKLKSPQWTVTRGRTPRRWRSLAG